MDNCNFFRAVDNGRVVEVTGIDYDDEAVFLRDGEKAGWDDLNDIQLLQCTGLSAAKSYRGDRQEDLMIYIGDITRLVLPDGEGRDYEVAIKTVTREVVSHPEFDEETAKVAITGVVFLWNGYELFPCVDDNGIVDTCKMEIIGTVFDKGERVD